MTHRRPSSSPAPTAPMPLAQFRGSSGAVRGWFSDHTLPFMALQYRIQRPPIENLEKKSHCTGNPAPATSSQKSSHISSRLLYIIHISGRVQNEGDLSRRPRRNARARASDGHGDLQGGWAAARLAVAWRKGGCVLFSATHSGEHTFSFCSGM